MPGQTGSLPSQMPISNPFGSTQNNGSNAASNNGRQSGKGSVRGNKSEFGESEQFVDCVDQISNIDAGESSRYESFNSGQPNFNPNFRKSANEQLTPIHEERGFMVRNQNRENSEFRGFQESEEKNNKTMKHQKILAQIDYFINGTMSNLLSENEEDEIYCNLDDDGYIFDEDGDYVLDLNGNRVRLSPEEIEKFKNNNMIE